MSLLFVVQVWNIEFYQCLELVHITLPVIEITHYQGDYTTSYYIYIVTTPVVQQYKYLVLGRDNILLCRKPLWFDQNVLWSWVFDGEHICYVWWNHFFNRQSVILVGTNRGLFLADFISVASQEKIITQ